MFNQFPGTGYYPGFCNLAKEWFRVASGGSFIDWMVAGAPKPNSLRIKGDVFLTSLATAVALVVATAPSVASQISTTPLTVTEVAAPLGGVFRTIDQVTPALPTPFTRYYYNLSFDGVVDPARWQSAVCAPAQGVATAYRVAYISCSDIDHNSNFNTADYILDRLPQVVVHLGDLRYLNYAGTDITWPRKYLLREFVRNSQAKNMLAHCAFVWGIDDHELYNDASLDDHTPNVATIFSNMLQVYKETCPHFDLIDSRCLMQEWWYGSVYNLLLDTRLQRSTGTVLGNGTTPPGSFDQFSEFKARVLAAKAAGAGRIVVWCPTGIPAAAYQGWREHAPLEYAAIMAWVVANAPDLVFWRTGDVHSSHAIDVIDAPHSGSCIISSPCFNGGGTALGGAQPSTWLGVNSEIFYNHRQVCIDDFGNDNHCITEISGRLFPESTTDVTIGPLRYFNTRDLGLAA